MKMIRIFAVLFFMSTLAHAGLFQSDMSTSAGWTTSAESADDVATWGYDYSVMGIPPAPGNTDTIGLRLEGNLSDGAPGGVTAWTDLTFAGNYVAEFDVWGNYGFDNGTTEYFGGGIGHNQSTINKMGNTVDGAGGWLAMVSDASSDRDYRMVKDSSEQFIASGQYAVASNASQGGEFDTISPSVDVGVPPLNVQGQTGTTPLGGPSFNWHHVKITVDGTAGTAKFEIDTLELGTLDANVGGAAFPTSGAVALFHWDAFDSIAAPTGLTFSIYDNVSVVPEPTSASILALSMLGLLGMRRRS